MAMAEASLQSLQSTVALPAPLPAATATATLTCNSCNKTSSKVAAKGKSKPEINSDKLLISPADSSRRERQQERERGRESDDPLEMLSTPGWREQQGAEGGGLLEVLGGYMRAMRR